MTMEFQLDGKVILPGEMYRWNLEATPGATTLSASITGRHMDLVGKPISILDDSGFAIFTGKVLRISSDGRSTDFEAIDDLALRRAPADQDQRIIDMVVRDSIERAGSRRLGA